MSNTILEEVNNGEEDDDRIFSADDMAKFAFHIARLYWPGSPISNEALNNLIQSEVRFEPGDGSFESYDMPSRTDAVKNGEEVINGIKVVYNTEKNRVQIFYTGLMTDDLRRALTSSGFTFSHYHGAWQRLLSNSAVWAAKNILTNL